MTYARMGVAGAAGALAALLMACAPLPPAEAPPAPPATLLHVESLGNGPALVLLHGFGASAYTWRHLAPELARQHRVLLVDLKGFGRAPKPGDDRYSAHDQAALVYALIEREELEGVTLVGHSYGGGIALLTALRLMRHAPQRLGRLVLIDSPAYQQEPPDFIRILQTPLLGRLVLWLMPPETQVRHVMHEAFEDDRRITQAAVTHYAQSLDAPGGRQALLATAHGLRKIEADPITRRYPTLTIPTLLVWGREDRIVPLSVGERLARELPDARLVVIDGCGHMPQEERPARTLAAVKEFLAGAPR